MKAALIGYGYWGKKIYNTLLDFFNKEDIYIVDTQKKISHAPQISFDSLLTNKKIKKIFVATPEETHFSLAKEILENEKDVFIEKPLCLKKKEAQLLVQVAQQQKNKLFVDYIFLYDPFIRKIKNIIDEKHLGKVLVVESIRHSISIDKPEITVFDDLAIHDIYILSYLFNEEFRINSINNFHKYFATAHLQSNSIDFFGHYSWMHPTVQRDLIIIGTKKTLFWSKKTNTIEIYKDQSIEKTIAVKQKKPPLYLAIDSFLNSTEVKENNYVKDVLLLEKMSTALL